MSVATRFKYHRTFPWCYGDFPPPSSGFDYVDAPSDPLDPLGQTGLTSVMNLWWNLENLKITPSGTMLIPPLLEMMFTQVYEAPDGDYVTDTPFVDLSGSIIAGDADDPVANPPRNRVCFGASSVLAGVIAYDYGGLVDKRESGEFLFSIAFVSGVWRLYYSFLFRLSDAATSMRLDIRNPSGTASGDPEVASGAFNIGAFDLEWVADSAAIIEAGSVDLQAEATFYTYP